MTFEPTPATVDSGAGGWAPAPQFQPAGTLTPNPYGYVAQPARPGSSGTVFIVAGVLLSVSAVVGLIVPAMYAHGSASLWEHELLPVIASAAVAVMLFMPGSRRLGQGIAVGYAFWAIPETFYFAGQLDSTPIRLNVASYVLAGAASIVAASGWRRSPRAGSRAIGAAGAAVTAALAIGGFNLTWVHVTTYGYACCPAYTDRAWYLAGDLVELVILVGVLIWAATGYPSRRSAGQFIGIALGLTVVLLVTVLEFPTPLTVGPGLYVTVLAIVVCVGTAVIGLSAGEPEAELVDAGSPAPMAYAPSAYPGAMAYPVAQTNTLAILAIVFAFVFSPLGIIFGHVARGQIRRSGEQGAGLALAGLIIGYVFTGISVLYLLLGVILLSSMGNA